MNIGGVLAGGGGLSCKLQAGVGALDLIGEGESAFINRTSFVSWIISHDYTHHVAFTVPEGIIVFCGLF